jgi:hypothetical protein
MKRFALLVTVSVLAGVGLLGSGCKEGSTTTTTGGKGFELETITDQSVTQADSNNVKVTIDRKGGFDGNVLVEVSGLPAGVTVEGGSPQTILAKDETLNIKLLATDSAAPTDKKAVTVRASAVVDGQNLSRENVFNLKVKARGS